VYAASEKVPDQSELISTLGKFAKSRIYDGFVRSSRSRLAYPEEGGVLIVLRSDEGYA
jgi:hypothetical protein